MLRRSKIAAGILAIIMCMLPIYVVTFAAEMAPEMQINTDKSEYTGDETIKEIIVITNVTNNDIKDAVVSGNVPDGYLADVENSGEKYSARWTYDISELASGETKEVTITMAKEDSETSVPGDTQVDDDTNDTDVTEGTNGTNGTNSVDGTDDNGKGPVTGDSFLPELILFAGVLSLAALVFLGKKKKEKGKKILSFILAVLLAGSVFQVNGTGVMAAESGDGASEEKTVDAESNILIDGKTVTLTAQLTYYEQEETEDRLSYDGYSLIWQDEFDGTELNRDDWNVELHAPGWVNAEWQEYVDSSENIYLEDGRLVIKPIKTVNDDGSTSYTSGRINTQGKHDFTYGLFEARVKVPEGQGYLPAFWLMASDENVYGQWPRCGEIDIMEVHGSDTDTTYGTIHYGNPHRETQGTYTLDNGSFSDEYHTFAVEWEPGRINWYVDGVLFHTADDWYSATEGQGEITYPAPFDQPFYLILNLAVGGSWVGYPDETTDFENAAYEIDYVRVYQKDSYDENVTKPEKEVILRDPDANGNYIVNGDFAVAEDLEDDEDWIFLQAAGGTGAAAISQNQIFVSTESTGTENHSIQLVQPNLPLKKGGTYTLTFDAYADSPRTMIVDVSAPDRSWQRYMPDTTVDLTTTKQTYTYVFTMTDEDDANGRLEFNMGKNESTAGISISNVTLKMTDYQEVVDDGKKVMLADGNYVYNGGFQEGEGRTEYWDIENGANADISVTNLADGRRLKVVIPEGVTSGNTVLISQSDLAMTDGGEYALSYDIQGTAGTSVDVVVAGQASYSVNLTGEVQTGNTYKFTAESANSKNLEFIFSQPGTYYLDNVRIDEDSLIKNGSFSAGLAGYEPFVDGSASATYVVDSLTEDNAIDFTINNTGDAAWKIQLKQNNVELENGQWYRLSFDAKSSINRQLMFAIQRDGSVHTNDSGGEDWTPYSGEKIVDLTDAYQNYSLEFQMTEPTDLHSILSISMGAVGNVQITNQHRICIDNIVLEKIEPPAVTTKPVGEELLKDTTFSDAANNWTMSVNAESSVAVENGTSVWTIGDAGVNDWDIQLKQEGIQLEQGCNYELKFTAESTVARSIKWDFMSSSYVWYYGESVELEANTPKEIAVTFTMSNSTDVNSSMTVSMGKMASGDTPASTIRLSGFSLKKVDATASQDDNLLTNGDFSEGETGWSSYVDSAASATASFADGKSIFTITNVGSYDWNIQLKQSGITLEQGASYTLTFTATSDASRSIKVSSMDSTNANWYGGGNVSLEANIPQEITMTITTGEHPTDTDAYIQVGMGQIVDDSTGAPVETPASIITLENFKLVKNQ